MGRRGEREGKEERKGERGEGGKVTCFSDLACSHFGMQRQRHLVKAAAAALAVAVLPAVLSRAGPAAQRQAIKGLIVLSDICYLLTEELRGTQETAASSSFMATCVHEQPKV